jgi:hypothetical protein
MEFTFIAPDPRRFDEANVELCLCGIWKDERPMRGLAGLIDWRLGGRLSDLLKTGFATGERGESLLLPGRPHVSFDKILVIGLGLRSDFDETTYDNHLLSITRALERLRVRRCVLELPGRSADAIDPSRAIVLAWKHVGKSLEHDAWCIVDTADAREEMAAKAMEARRRARMP